jgi:hypothetical protein
VTHVCKDPFCRRTRTSSHNQADENYKTSTEAIKPLFSGNHDPDGAIARARSPWRTRV